MRKLLRYLAFVLLTMTAVSASAADGFLVPIFYGDPGAFGSVWRTRLTIFNNSDQTLLGIPFVYDCPIPEGCQGWMPPKSTLTFVASDGFRYTNGFFLFPGVASVPVSFTLRVFDQSRATMNNGTDIPVVPLSAFTERPLELLDVPVAPAFRLTLRLYALPPATPTVRVTVLQDTAPTSSAQPPAPRVVTERFVTLELSPFGPSAGSFSRPAGAVVSDLPLTGTSSLRIEIQSTTPGVPIWGFATLTNNDTQFVTVIAPTPQA